MATFSRLVLIFSVLLLALVGCQHNAEPAARAKKLRLVATTGMVGDLARRIGGDDIELKVLMGPGVDPHLYKASPGDIRALRDADLVLYNGHHLEGKMTEVFESLGKQKAVVAVTSAVPQDKLLKFGDTPDPHIWFDVELWTAGCEVVGNALGELLPAKKEVFNQEAATYATELKALDSEVKVQLAQLGPKGILVTSHDAFGYFGRAYGLEVHAVQGLSTDSEAGLQEINQLVNLIVTKKVPTIFTESSVSPKNMEALREGAAARGWTVKFGEPLYSDAMGGPGTGADTYPGMVRANAKAVLDGLK